MPERSRIFYFDVASPYSYLAAARIEELIADVTWQPILVGALHKHYHPASWGATPALRTAGLAEIERRASAYGLPRSRGRTLTPPIL